MLSHRLPPGERRMRSSHRGGAGGKRRYRPIASPCRCRVKILQLVQTLDPETGGVARAVASLSAAIKRRAVDVEIVTLDDAASPWVSASCVAVHPLGVGLTSYRYSAKLLPWLRANRSRFDAVIIN